MSDRSIAASPAAFSPAVPPSRAATRPVAARTRLLLEAPVLPTLLRLSAPNVLNLLAIAGMITFDGLFLGRLGPDRRADLRLLRSWEALYFATQGFRSVIWTVTANAVRLLASTGCALIAVYWLDLGAIGFFVAIAGGFCAYAALTSAAIFRVKKPSAQPIR
jgi:hypothetical protein